MTPIKFDSKKQLYDYLRNNDFSEYEETNLSSVYFLVKYQYKDQTITEPLYFFPYQNVYFASPCEVHYFEMKENEIEEYVKEMYDINEYNYEDVLKYEKLMHRGNIHYDIDCPQVSPFLPDEVTILEIFTETDCLNYELNLQKELENNER